MRSRVPTAAFVDSSGSESSASAGDGAARRRGSRRQARSRRSVRSDVGGTPPAAFPTHTDDATTSDHSPLQVGQTQPRMMRDSSSPEPDHGGDLDTDGGAHEGERRARSTDSGHRRAVDDHHETHHDDHEDESMRPLWENTAPILPPPSPMPVPSPTADGAPAPIPAGDDPLKRIVQFLLSVDGARAHIDSIAAALDWDRVYESGFGDLREFLELHSSLLVVSPVGGMVTFRDAAKFTGSRRVTRANREAILSYSASIGHVSCTSVAKRIKLAELRTVYHRRGLEAKIVDDAILHVAYAGAFDLFVFEEGAVVWWGANRSDHWVVEADFVAHNHVTAHALIERHDSVDINALYPIWWTYSVGKPGGATGGAAASGGSGDAAAATSGNAGAASLVLISPPDSLQRNQQETGGSYGSGTPMSVGAPQFPNPAQHLQLGASAVPRAAQPGLGTMARSVDSVTSPTIPPPAPPGAQPNDASPKCATVDDTAQDWPSHPPTAATRPGRTVDHHIDHHGSHAAKAQQQQQLRSAGSSPIPSSTATGAAFSGGAASGWDAAGSTASASPAGAGDAAVALPGSAAGIAARAQRSASFTQSFAGYTSDQGLLAAPRRRELPPRSVRKQSVASRIPAAAVIAGPEALPAADRRNFAEALPHDHFVVPATDRVNVMTAVSCALAQSVTVDYLEYKISALSRSSMQLPQQLRLTGGGDDDDEHGSPRRGGSAGGTGGPSGGKKQKQEAALALADAYRAAGNVHVHKSAEFGLTEEPIFIWERPRYLEYYELAFEQLSLRQRADWLHSRISVMSEAVSAMTSHLHLQAMIRADWFLILLLLVDSLVLLTRLIVAIFFTIEDPDDPYFVGAEAAADSMALVQWHGAHHH